jgi:hypothetical protein
VRTTHSRKRWNLFLKLARLLLDPDNLIVQVPRQIRLVESGAILGDTEVDIRLEVNQIQVTQTKEIGNSIRTIYHWASRAIGSFLSLIKGGRYNLHIAQEMKCIYDFNLERNMSLKRRPLLPATEILV